MSEANARKRLAVDTMLLDSMVMEYMTSENLVDGSASNSTPQAQSAAALITLQKSCQAAKSMVAAGRVDDAFNIANSIDPNILKDLRLQYTLKTRKFVETLRPRTPETLKEALECLRDEVAPLALIAYPEAYEELRRTVLLLVVNEGDGLFGCTDELWLKQTTTLVAGMFSRTIRQAAGVTHPKLALILRYLAFTHSTMQQQDPSAPELNADDGETDQIISKLLGSDRDPAPLPAEGVPQVFREADIQALKEAMQLMRQEAIQALKHTAGDVNKAFINELSAFDLRLDVVDNLVRNYAAQRKLVQTGESPQSSSCGANSAEAVVGCESGDDMEVDVVTLDPPGAPTAAQRLLARTACSSPPRKRARWRGREPAPEEAPPGPSQPPSEPGLPQSSQSATGAQERPWMRPFVADARREQVQRVGNLLKAGLLDMAMNEIKELAPHFIEANKDVDFTLHTAKFYQEASHGNMPEAIAYSRAHMTPLTHNSASRTEMLKSALTSAMTESACELHKNVNYTAISSLVTEALDAVLGLKEPQLVQVLRVLLDSHKEWYQRQRCRDPFEGLLGLDGLRKGPNPEHPFRRRVAGPIRQQAEPGAGRLLPTAAAPAVVPPGEDDNIQISITDADDEAERESARQAARRLVDTTEQNILTVMEFSGLGRAAAMDLLVEFNGNPEAALANIYG
ncbi:hypothetical protein CVIRNUC_004127 [Coccomyxa viridis]|uniref:CTLH domain-containing protein n=1 Tax=Coccomyxa viridis TaxID=1274662 RepID=A0AAV1I2I6_9CHLO|nr:hypothetical protein CVIRNUC_004127 [Coccomyxa viridis]